MKIKYLFILFTIALISCKKEKISETTEKGSFVLEFENLVNETPLVLGTSTYKNANGDSFNVSAFNYYISNIVLTKDDGSVYKIPESSMLIDASKPAPLLNSLTAIPVGDYTQISFTTIFVKLEGSSPQSTATNNSLTFHIGGSGAVRTHTKAFTSGNPLRIRTDKKPQVHFKVNAASLFTGKQNIRFADFNFTEDDAKSIIVADNYANGLFQSVHIHN